MKPKDKIAMLDLVLLQRIKDLKTIATSKNFDESTRNYASSQLYECQTIHALLVDDNRLKESFSYLLKDKERRSE